MNRQAIVPVIGVTLLLVTAVLSAVFFQTWFSNFQSELFVDVESQSQINNFRVGIENLLGDELFVNAGDGLNITKISIDGNDCNFTGVVTGVRGINVRDCIDNLTTNTPNIVLVTNGGVISEKVFLDNNIFENLITSTSYTNILNLSCVWNSNKNGCEDVFLIDGCGLDTVLDSSIGLCWIRNIPSLNRNWSESISYCENLIFANHSDWYLPSRQEIERIVDYSRPSSPFVIGGGGSGIFNNLPSAWFWTRTPRNTGSAYHVAFNAGYSTGANKGAIGRTICVRKENFNIRLEEQQIPFLDGVGQRRVTENFFLNGCGNDTILDNLTGICWIRNLNLNGSGLMWSVNLSYESPIWNGSAYLWPSGRNASDYPLFNFCNDLNLGGHEDWRVPSRGEILTLVNEVGVSDTCSQLNLFGFNNCNNFYWTSTSVSQERANRVSFLTGELYHEEKTDFINALCMRTDY